MDKQNPSPQTAVDQLPASFQADKAGNIKMAIQFNLSGDEGGTQVVDVNIGVHAMIPKSLFDEDLRQSIKIA